MASFMCDLVKPYVEKLIDKAIGEARHVFCFTCIVKEFEEERDTLESAKRTVEQRVEVAKGRDKDIIAKVPIWETKVDELLQLDTKTKQTCFCEFCPNCIWRYKRGKELVNDLELIKQLKEEEKTLVDIELPHRLPDVERHSSLNYISFNSREVKYKEMLDALKDDSNYIVGLHGMGGTGKTTLAKEVGKELKQSKQCSLVIDTTVSFTPNIKKIQDDIAGPLGLELDGCNESDRPKKLWSRLTNGEKILLIIDDVWDNQETPFDFDLIGIPKQGKHSGCRVLVTSRSKQLLVKMDCDNIIVLDLLTEDESWKMFERCSGISNGSKNDLIRYGRLIVKECKQLPIAIAITASNLKGQHQVHEWKVTLQSLRNIGSVHGFDDATIGIYKSLRVSYDYMKDKKAKRLFLMCSLFQEDAEIQLLVLERLCIGAGVFEVDYGSYGDARNQVFVAKNILVNACLLLEGDEECVKMHDLVRDVAQQIANREIQCVNLSNKNQKLLVEREKIFRYLLCEGKVIDLLSYNKFDGSKLEILIVGVEAEYDDLTCMEVPDSFFKNIVKLRVLFFSGTNRSKLLSLPHSIRLLTNIRSMIFVAFDLGDISFLGYLESLETLDLFRCTINELPIEITKLEKFKLLNLSECTIRTKNPFEVIKSCSSLEELCFVNSFNRFCQEITFHELQRYRISNKYRDATNDPSLSKYVVLKGGDYKLSKETFKYCMETAEVLKIASINSGWKNLMPEIVPINQGMNDLVELCLDDDSQLQYLVDTKHIGSQVPNVFSKLVVLELVKMEGLEELCNGLIDSMENLEILTIKKCRDLRSLFKGSLNLSKLKTVTLEGCSSLVSVFDLSTCKSLLLLEKLIIFDCDQLENIFTYERRVDDAIEEILVDGDNKSCNSLFPKLKFVNIEFCSQLQFIFPLFSAKDLLLLEAITVSYCDNLKHIFNQYQNVELASLKKLCLHKGLHNFIGIFPESDHPMPMPSSIEESYDSISKPQTKLEPMKCNIFSWSDICCQRYRSRGTACTEIYSVSDNQPHDCSISMELNVQQLNLGLEDIELEDLPMMTNLFVGTKNSLALQHLTTLKILRCEELEIVFSTSIIRCLPQLYYLRIQECNELKHIFEEDTQNKKTCFPKLEALVVLKCNKLKSVFPVSICNKFPKLETLIIQEANELQQVFETEGDQKVETSNLKFVVFVNLSSLCHSQWIQFQDVPYCVAHNCQNGSLRTSSSYYVKNFIELCLYRRIDPDFQLELMQKVFKELQENFECNCTDSEDYAVEVEVQATSEEMSISSQGMLTEQSTSHLGEIYTAVKPSQGIKLSFDLGDSKQKTQTNNQGSLNGNDNQGEVNSNVEEQFPKDGEIINSKSKGTAPSITSRIASQFQPSMPSKEDSEAASRHELTSSQIKMKQASEAEHETVQNVPDLEEGADNQIAMTSFSIATTETNDEASLNDDTFMQVSSTIQQQFSGFGIPSVDNSPTNSQGSTSEKTEAKTMSPISEPKNEPDIQLHAPKLMGIKLSASPSISLTKHLTINDDQVSLNDNTLSTIEHQTPSMPSKDSDLYLHMENSYRQFQEKSKGHHNGNENSSAQTTKEFADWIEAEAASRHKLTSSQIKMKQEEEAKREFVQNVPDLEISPESMNEQSMDQQCLMKPQQSVAEIDITVKHSQENNLEDSTSELAAGTLSTSSRTKNEPPIQLDIALKQKDIEIRVEEGTTSTITMEDINKLIAEDPLLALEKLLTGVQSFSIGTLLQELKTLMDSSSDLDHLVSNQESKSKLISLFHGLNQHQGLLPSDVKEFVQKVQNFFNDYIIKHATSQQVLKKHNQLLDSKTDLMNKLRTAKSTQIHIDSETLTANAKIHELSLQIVDLENQRDGLKSLVNKCDAQKMKLKAECTEWAQQSKELLSALASSEVEVREAERARNLTKEGFANLKSSFPTF